MQVGFETTRREVVTMTKPHTLTIMPRLNDCIDKAPYLIWSSLDI